MAITITSENYGGEVQARVIDDQGVLYELIGDARDPGLEIAHMIDPYGNSWFNQIQVPMFLRDLQVLAALAATPSDAAKIRQIEELARQTLGRPHNYLRFFGA